VGQANNLLLVSSVVSETTIELNQGGEMQMSVISLTTLGMLISSRQEDSAVAFVAWIILGLVVGFIGSKILNKTGHGLVRDVLLGIVGAIVGGFLSNLLGKPGVTGLDLYSLFVAVVGAVVFMIAYHALFRRRRFLSMR
jgi:uncharacterized membrane protein YeaQ/YmgE (transglycosylase-associated protein family)